MFFLIFITKTLLLMEFFFSILCTSLTLSGNFMPLESNFLAKSQSNFMILLGLWHAGCKYLTKHQLKHSLSSLFLILINPFLGWSDFFDNFM